MAPSDAAGIVTLADLRRIVGAANARAAREGDAVAAVQPRFVVAPATIAEASATLRLAHEAGLAVAPRGGGTKLGWGNPPRRVDVVLRTERLNRVLEHAAGDLVVRAEAGVTLESLQETVARAGQMLALNPPERGATLGGIVAANASGYRRLRYGTVRDLIIGITVVLSDGTVAHAGGKVVKNVAGYDLAKLFSGSLGTLGLIVETIFRLHPLPDARRTVVVEVASPAQAGAAVQDLLHAPLSPLALDALDLRWSAGRGTLAVLFEGVTPGVEAQATTALRLLAPYGPARIPEGDEADRLWADLAAYPWQGDDEAGLDDRVGLKVAALPADLSWVLSAIDDLSRRAAITPHVVSHAGNGITLIGIGPALRDTMPATQRFVEQLRERIGSAGGSVVVPHAPAAFERRVDAWGPAGDALPLMRRVKERFDPGNIMNPGRFVGGI